MNPFRENSKMILLQSGKALYVSILISINQTHGNNLIYHKEVPQDQKKTVFLKSKWLKKQLIGL